jgi:hypothetical protein
VIVVIIIGCLLTLIFIKPHHDHEHPRKRGIVMNTDAFKAVPGQPPGKPHKHPQAQKKGPPKAPTPEPETQIMQAQPQPPPPPKKGRHAEE